MCFVGLKKSDSSDRAVGQLLRYVGLIRNDLKDLENASEAADIEGQLIVSDQPRNWNMRCQQFQISHSAGTISMWNSELRTQLSTNDHTPMVGIGYHDSHAKFRDMMTEPTRIGLLSDIHSNAVALKAVLDDMGLFKISYT